MLTFLEFMLEPVSSLNEFVLSVVLLVKFALWVVLTEEYKDKSFTLTSALSILIALVEGKVAVRASTSKFEVEVVSLRFTVGIVISLPFRLIWFDSSVLEVELMVPPVCISIAVALEIEVEERVTAEEPEVDVFSFNLEGVDRLAASTLNS